MKRILAALVLVVVFLDSGVAVARGFTGVLENDGVPSGALITFKPYYDLVTADPFYNLNLTVAHPTFWDNISFISASEVEYHPEPDKQILNYFYSEEGVEAVFGHVAVGGGLTTQYNPITKTQTEQVFGAFSVKLWN